MVDLSRHPDAESCVHKEMLIHKSLKHNNVLKFFGKFPTSHHQYLATNIINLLIHKSLKHNNVLKFFGKFSKAHDQYLATNIINLLTVWTGLWWNYAPP